MKFSLMTPFRKIRFVKRIRAALKKVPFLYHLKLFTMLLPAKGF
jgi:hypothetical protein